jgi:MFS family permease
MVIDLTVHKNFRYVLFSSLYFAEGLYQALILIVTPIYLLEKNVPLPLLTLIMGLGYLPWGLKFVWGGIIDFYHKYGRKKFAIIGTIFGACGFLVLSIIDQYFSILFFTIFLFLGYTGIGFLDAATDAWAIDTTKVEERGKINSSMIIGQWIGKYLGALLIITLGVGFGYNISFMVSGFVVLLFIIAPLSVKYQDRKIGELRIWSLIKQEFRKSITRRTVLYIFIIPLHHALYFTMLVIFLKTVLNLDDMFIGVLFALWLIAVIPGSFIGGYLSDKYGRKKILYVFLICLLIVSVIPIFISDFYLLIINFSFLMFFMNGVIAANWALIMDIINPKISASEHEVICSIGNMGTIIIGSATGALIVLLGFNNLFIISGIIILLSIVILNRIKNIEKIKWDNQSK